MMKLPDEEDVDSFLKKVEDVERQLRGLQDGSIAPKDVHVPGDWSFNAAGGASNAKAAKAAKRDKQDRPMPA